MKNEIFREPLEGDNGCYVYTWSEPNLFQMQWSYGVEWRSKRRWGVAVTLRLLAGDRLLVSL
jgi:hypothetical protein